MLHSVFIMKDTGHIIFEKNISDKIFVNERITNLARGLLFSYINFSRDIFSEEIKRVEFDKYNVTYYPIRKGKYNIIFVNDKGDVRTKAVISFLTALITVFLNKIEREKSLEDAKKEDFEKLVSILEKHITTKPQFSLREIYDTARKIFEIIKNKLPSYQKTEVEEVTEINKTDINNHGDYSTEGFNEGPILDPLEDVNEEFFNGNIREVLRKAKMYLEDTDKGDIFKLIYIKAWIVASLLGFTDQEELMDKKEILNLLTGEVIANDKVTQVMKEYLITLLATLYYPDLLNPEELHDKIEELENKIVGILESEAIQTNIRDAFINVTFPLDSFYINLANKFISFLSADRERLPYIWTLGVINNDRFEKIKYKIVQWDEFRKTLLDARKRFHDSRKNYIKTTRLLPATKLQPYEVHLSSLEYLRSLVDYINAITIASGNKSLSINDIEENINMALLLWMDLKKDLERKPKVILNDLFSLFYLISELYYLKYQYFISRDKVQRFQTTLDNEFSTMLEIFIETTKNLKNFPKIYQDLHSIRLFNMFALNYKAKSKIWGYLRELFNMLLNIDASTLEEFTAKGVSFELAISLLRGLSGIVKGFIEDDTKRIEYLKNLVSYYDKLYMALLDEGKICELLLIEQLEIINEIIKCLDDKDEAAEYLNKAISIYNYGIHNPEITTPTKIRLTDIISNIVSSSSTKLDLSNFIDDIKFIDNKLKWAISIWSVREEQDKVKDLVKNREKIKDIILTVT